MGDHDFTALPEELTALPQWVTWRTEEREGKPTKVPYRADGQGRASTTNPDTWAPYDEAVLAMAHHGHDGVGFVFSADDPFAGVDFDHVVEGGTVHPDAQRLVASLDSYTEWSPSGDGLHVIVRGTVTGPRKIDAPWGPKCLERYDHGRFFTMTRT